MSLDLQIAVTGLAAGGTYGLVAVGYSIIYRATPDAYGPTATTYVFATASRPPPTASQVTAGGDEPAFAKLVLAIALGAVGVAAVTVLWANS